MYSNAAATEEQRISHKLRLGEELSKAETEIFESLSSFYENLDYELAKLDYAPFTIQDIKDFKNYLQYAFNYTVFITTNYLSNVSISYK